MPWSDTPSSRHRTQVGWLRRAENRRILVAHKGICHVCSSPGATQVDHVIPLHQDPTGDTPANKRPICDACHKVKTASEAAAARWATTNRRNPEPHPGLR